MNFNGIHFYRKKNNTEYVLYTGIKHQFQQEKKWAHNDSPCWCYHLKIINHWRYSSLFLHLLLSHFLHLLHLSLPFLLHISICVYRGPWNVSLFPPFICFPPHPPPSLPLHNISIWPHFSPCALLPFFFHIPVSEQGHNNMRRGRHEHCAWALAYA